MTVRPGRRVRSATPRCLRQVLHPRPSPSLPLPNPSNKIDPLSQCRRHLCQRQNLYRLLSALPRQLPLYPRLGPWRQRLSMQIISDPVLQVSRARLSPCSKSNSITSLIVTESQYKDARDAILDLLGWGVSPEYLVNCGVSREVIYYIFVEYNLRLPENLDVTGLPPIGPLLVATSSASSPIQSTSAPHKSQDQAESSSLSASATPFVPGTAVATVSALSPPSLHDMEQQRKQELLARKAAMASRKLKQQASTSSVDATSSNSRAIPSASPRRDSNSSKPVHTKTVDDFLNSIEKAGPSKNAADKSNPNSNPSSTA